MPLSSWILSMVLAVTLRAAAAPAGAERVLAEAGQSAYTIRLREEATPAERWAAEELRRCLQAITGADFPLQTGGALPARGLLVGADAAVCALAPDLAPEKLGPEQLVVRTAGPHLLLAGGRPRGTLYAVFSFLDEELGCRWLAPDCEILPPRPRLAFGDLNRSRTPVFEEREPFSYTAFDGDWAAHNYSNCPVARLEERHGGHVTMEGWGHTFYLLVPPGQFFAAHPEWYSERAGKRFHEGGQLCLTNPEVVRQVVAGVRAWLQANPKADIVSVSQNDCFGFCECPRCKAVDDEEGSHSGTLIRFVNQVAEAIEPEFPRVVIDTLAYQYTRKPPRLARPRPNVLIRLCDIECCFTHPLTACEKNASFCEDLAGWSKICRRVWVWDYVTNFNHYLLPHPNLDVLGPNIRLFAQHGVRGVIEQGNRESPGGEMMELRSYVLARLLWNPEYGAARARDEFLAGYYGPAAPQVAEYLALMHASAARAPVHLGFYAEVWETRFAAADIARAEALFDEAERRVAGQPVLLQRVRTARLPILYAAVVRGRAWARYARSHGRQVGSFGAGWSRRAALEKFLAAAAEAKVTWVKEGGTLSQFRDRLLSEPARRENPPPPPGTEGVPPARVVDVQDDEFRHDTEGPLTGFRADESASDGVCAWVTGATNQWVMQCWLALDPFEANARYRAYVVAKVRKVKDEGTAFAAGIWDDAAGRPAAQIEVKAADASTDWKVYELGRFEAKGKPWFWAAGAQNAAVPEILVDRIFFVQE